MIQTYARCGQSFDDAEAFTFCPHAPLMAAEDMARKIAAIALLGHQVRYKASRAPAGRVTAIRWNGWVHLEGEPEAVVHDAQELEGY